MTADLPPAALEDVVGASDDFVVADVAIDPNEHVRATGQHFTRRSSRRAESRVGNIVVENREILIVHREFFHQTTEDIPIVIESPSLKNNIECTG